MKAALEVAGDAAKRRIEASDAGATMVDPNFMLIRSDAACVRDAMSVRPSSFGIRLTCFR